MVVSTESLPRLRKQAGQSLHLNALKNLMGGPPLHIHGTEEEYFFVTEGEMTFFIDGKITKVKAGESAFALRGKVHCYKNCTNQDARMLAIFTPGKIEGYFDFGLPMEDGSIPSEACIIERFNAMGQSNHGAFRQARGR